MYILECANGQYYTGSTKDLEKRLAEHQAGEGANFTKKHLPVKLVYFEEFQRIDKAFYREKQVQGWSRQKKEALISGKVDKLHGLAECRNESHCRNGPFGDGKVPFGSAQGTGHGGEDAQGKGHGGEDAQGTGQSGEDAQGKEHGGADAQGTGHGGEDTQGKGHGGEDAQATG